MRAGEFLLDEAVTIGTSVAGSFIQPPAIGHLLSGILRTSLAATCHGTRHGTTWPRTDTGLLTTRRQQLQLNTHLPAIAELLQVRAMQKMLNAFGDSLLEAINPVTGRIHASFLIAGAHSGRFTARGPNLQQSPKQREAGFRKIFAAPVGQLVMALDYSQIELRAVGELISDWFGYDSILRQSFAAGMDAHIATAMCR